MAVWEARGDAEWAEFERRSAAFEREAARLEAGRAELARLRVRLFQAGR
jgi:hypothetical protein